MPLNVRAKPFAEICAVSSISLISKKVPTPLYATPPIDISPKPVHKARVVLSNSALIAKNGLYAGDVICVTRSAFKSRLI